MKAYNIKCRTCGTEIMSYIKVKECEACGSTDIVSSRSGNLPLNWNKILQWGLIGLGAIVGIILVCI